MLNKTEQHQKCEDILRELVRLRELKDKIEHRFYEDHERVDYETNKPIAWNRAKNYFDTTGSFNWDEGPE